MATDISILKKLLEVAPQPSRDDKSRNIKWTEVDALIDSSTHDVPQTTNVQRLVSYIVAAINALPKRPTQKSVKQTVSLAGKVWSHLIINGNTYSNKKKAMREAVKEHLFGGDFAKGEDFLRAPDVLFDNRARTIAVNQANADKADVRQNNAVEISPERVEKIVKQMVADLESGDPRYATVAILLGDLCFGARWVESLMFSEFKADAKETATGRNKVKTRWVTQTGIAKKFNRGVDNRAYSIYKPSLPYADAAYVVDGINNFRSTRQELLDRLGSYDANNPAHKRAANRYRRAANLLLQKRYFLDLLSRKEAKEAKSGQRAASSHLLRAIWVNLSYELFHKRGQAKDRYVKDMLGHDSKEPGSRYTDVIIITAEEDSYLANMKFGNVSKKQIEEAPEQAEEEEEEALEQAEAPEQAEEEEIPEEKEFKEPPARRPPVKAREDNLEEPEDIVKENKQLKRRVAKLEQQQTIMIDMMRSLQEGFAKLSALE